MLTKSQEQLIKSLHQKKYRKQVGRCLVEGQKVVDVAESYVEFAFTADDSVRFEKLVTTKTPQWIAAVARIPEWSREQIEERQTIVLLDGVQDPGNVGAIFRLCSGFGASLLLVESADPTSPKVIRSSVGALFQVPWMEVARKEAGGLLASMDRAVLKLDAHGEAGLQPLKTKEPVVIIAGSEGRGILLNVDGEVLTIPHSNELESLNVGHSLAITLHERFSFLVA